MQLKRELIAGWIENIIILLLIAVAVFTYLVTSGTRVASASEPNYQFSSHVCNTQT